MSPRPDLGPKPRLGYTASLIERAAELRANAAALATLENDSRARAYVVGGEMVVLRRAPEVCDPLFTLAGARDLGRPAEIVFLGLLDGAPRFAVALDAAIAEALKTHDEFVVTDLRSIAVRGLVAADHLPPLAEGKALLNWHGRHRYCSNCGSATNVVEAGWRRDCPSCRAQHFPRTDPVAIMLPVARDRDRSRGTRRRPLVRSRRGCDDAAAVSSRRLDHAADRGHCLSHHSRLGGGRS